MTSDDVHSSFVVRHSSFENSTWLPAALLATLVLLASALQAFGQSQQLTWRPAFAPAKKQSAARRPVRHIVTRQQDARGYAVVQVAYEEDAGWASSSSEPQGTARMQSLLVHPRDPQFAGTGPAHRVAQDPFEDDNLDEDLSAEITVPFGEDGQDAELPEIEAGDLPGPVEPELPDDLVDDMTDGTNDVGPLFDDDSGDDLRTQPGEGTIQQLDTFEPTQLFDDRPADPPGPTNMEQYERERRDASESCEEELARVRADRISNIDLGIRVAGKEGWDYPFECIIDDGTPYAGRQWPEVTYMWKAAANCHKPLYFEQHHLERYGHSWGPCVQPLISGAHFFTRLPVLPYCMGLTPPNECIYPLGYYRPGNCAPYMVDPVPFSWRAALFQAGATVGTAAVLP